MDTVQSPFSRANYSFRRADYAHWHRQQSKQHILRSQLGFRDVSSSRPRACAGCVHYHGIAYGYNRDSRSLLVCGFHPYGWQQDDTCPDWNDQQ
ncbi:hypothetical protein [Leptolyngbya sp. FACHB-711]|uniref:hypothetical protein n=1 Tax=unclassified Leptolyngbya TaxID=2650499 RepID=UPI00168887A1|nr:hypothetical protein [Leptolyngbya sp. FACHB-711]MBD1852847.1 hypothetical protein [Cyanobacteria bacterium FACHB-502]MBD2025099.1 hypothetical protein [Leptolyngbya sp. FACHB-711]